MAYSALLDANVLYPWVLCDLLLRLAEEDLFRPLWSAEILGELRGSLRERRADLTDEQLDWRTSQMNEAFPDAAVDDYEDLIAAVEANDPGDKHVVAAAVAGRADVLVTANLADFSGDFLAKFRIQLQGPDDFLIDQLHLAPARVRDALLRQAAQRHPPMAIEEHLASLERHVPAFVAEVRRVLEFPN